MKALSPAIYMPDPSEIFRPELAKEKTGLSFRQYELASSETEDPHLKDVQKTYMELHTNQTVEFVKGKMEQWGKYDKLKLGLLDSLDLLNSFVDESDPDIAIPNSIHGYQTAERIRAVHPDKPWMHLVGLIHDLGKVLALWGEPQWAVVGDTFPVGCSVGPSVVLRDSTFSSNKDMKDTRYNTKFGIYKEHCGLDNVLLSWGHDEYLYRVLKRHNCTLPKEGLNMIRYHSFYPWHTGGDYKYLTNEEDETMLPWVREFNKFDLYTKYEGIPDIAALRPYYQSLVDQYCPGQVQF